MRLNEFKSWFDGFCEGLGRLPNENEWNMIRKKISALIEDVSIPSMPTHREFITTGKWRNGEWH